MSVVTWYLTRPSFANFFYCDPLVHDAGNVNTKNTTVRLSLIVYTLPQSYQVIWVPLFAKFINCNLVPMYIPLRIVPPSTRYHIYQGPRTFFFFLPIPFIVSTLLFSLLPSRNSDSGSLAGSSPPTHYGSCLAFLSREDFSSFFPRRLTSNYAYPRYSL